MKKYIIIVFILFPFLVNSQSLGAKRIEKLNKSVVRILIDSVPAGTGFFVHESGLIVTCNHVIESAYKRDSITNKLTDFKKIEIELNNGEIIESSVYNYLLNSGHRNAFSYDYSILKTKTKPKTIIETLKIGRWDDVNEGDVIYSCGYPLGIKQKFISQGILSTKWTEPYPIFIDTVLIDSVPRDVAWLDLTMNKGNSGGAIIKLGKTPSDDKVVGIATFILNPYGKSAGDLSEYLLSDKRTFDMIMGGISSNKINALYASAIANNSIGVSGCISIDYVRDVLIVMNPAYFAF